MHVSGGSYSTIAPHLSQVLADHGKPEPHATEMPIDLAEIGQRAILSIYTAIQNAANARIEIVERDAGLRTTRAERARNEEADMRGQLSAELQRAKEEAARFSSRLSRRMAAQIARLRQRRADPNRTSG